MRFVAPVREAVDPLVFSRPPLDAWSEYSALLQGPVWPAVAQIASAGADALSAGDAMIPQFAEQTPALLRDGLHYESRIAERGQIATRAENWHDLLNALIWLRYPAIKSALNARQVAEIAVVGAKRRSRAQYALTHFDEAGVIVQVSDPALLDLWDAHDWHGLFWREREAWRDGRIRIDVFGHALLEHSLRPSTLLVGKALVVAPCTHMPQRLGAAIRVGALLNDPLELRPLPLSGIVGWHDGNADEEFYAASPCFRSRRAGRSYPSPTVLH